MRIGTRRLMAGFKARNLAMQETRGMYAKLAEECNRIDRANVYREYRLTGRDKDLKETIKAWS